MSLVNISTIRSDVEQLRARIADGSEKLRPEDDESPATRKDILELSRIVLQLAVLVDRNLQARYEEDDEL